MKEISRPIWCDQAAVEILLGDKGKWVGHFDPLSQVMFEIELGDEKWNSHFIPVQEDSSIEICNLAPHYKDAGHS